MFKREKINLLKTLTVMVSLFATILISSCEQRDFEKKKAITTDEVTEKRPTSAVVTGTIIDIGEDGLVSVYGHVWSVQPYPEVGAADSTKRENARSTISFSSKLENLEAERKYYVRAYIIEKGEYIYGQQIEFETTPKLPPEVSMVSVENLAPSAATLVGKIDGFGEGAKKVTKYGFCWSESATSPTLENCDGSSEYLNTSELIEFRTGLTYLSSETTYYVKAYAANEEGLTYSDVSTFTTKRPGFGLDILMVDIAGGSFIMGSDKYFISEPEHSISLSAYSISKYEITNELFAQFLNEYGSQFIKNGQYKGESMCWEEESFGGGNFGLEEVDGEWQVATNGFDNNPAIHITWFGAYEFCRYYGGRLPTEAQWEYAAIGAAESNNYTYSGSNTLSEVGWYGEYSLTPPFGETHPVGMKTANEIGLHDMTGNAGEWCADWYATPYDTSQEADPTGPQNGKYKVIRGGAWSDKEYDMNVKMRKGRAPEYHSDDVGFRIVFNE